MIYPFFLNHEISLSIVASEQERAVLSVEVVILSASLIRQRIDFPRIKDLFCLISFSRFTPSFLRFAPLFWALYRKVWDSLKNNQ